ncbi:HAD family hydrolase [Gracilibacillus oryzae]|uniref:HAD family hydrolase n=1 Tax=Gracilibacillus oryzae TaxID=1672701 RepID=A0A7C8L248_9BACI|nr:HAD family hydrolase [Gracilibacillus oryzae]KAB8139439.1 HAD family hydrolase [Gracilibacillus oryzae]
MAESKALFLDIDGTILREDHSIEDSTKIAVKQAQSQGIEVFLATGRPLHEISDIAEALNITSFIGYNGAYALYQDQVLVNETMPAEMIEHYLKVAKENNHELILYTNKLNLLTSLDKEVVKQFIDYFHLGDVQLYSEEFANDILGITIMNVKPKEPALYNLDGDEIYLSQVNVKGMEHCYDVIRENVNKGIAVEKILIELNISPDEAIAFGDGMNDKQMLAYVGNSFAMGNCHPELLKHSRYQTSSVEESGIYNGLKTLGIIKDDD